MSVIAKEFRAQVKDGKPPAAAVAPTLVRDAATQATVSDATKRQMTFVISDATRDRANDSLFPEGCDFANYQKNPVLLFAHDYSSLPIGKCVDGPKLVNGQLVCTFEFLTADANPLSELVWQQVQAGTLRAISVGFRPLKAIWNDIAGGIDYLMWELLESSVVPVPCNPNALPVDGKGIDALEVIVKTARDAQAKAQKSASDEGAPPTTGSEQDIAQYMTSLASTAKAFEGHMKALGDMVAAKAVLLGRMDSATKALETCTAAIGEMMKDDGDDDSTDDAGSAAAPQGIDKGAPVTGIKGPSHAMSKAMLKQFGVARKALKSMKALHDGKAPPADDSSAPTDSDGDPAPSPKAAPVSTGDAYADWCAEMRRLGLDPDVEVTKAMAALLDKERGRLS